MVTCALLSRLCGSNTQFQPALIVNAITFAVPSILLTIDTSAMTYSAQNTHPLASLIIYL